MMSKPRSLKIRRKETLTSNLNQAKAYIWTNNSTKKKTFEHVYAGLKESLLEITRK